MRNISTLTKEEISEFFEIIDIGKFEISKFEYNELDEVFEVGTITFWETEDDNGNPEEVSHEDIWYFYNNYYDSEFPETHKSYLYQEFLLAKGFKYNRFKIYNNI